MNITNQLLSIYNNQIKTHNQTHPINSKNEEKNIKNEIIKPTSSTGDNLNLSPLSRLLCNAERRASLRDNSMSRDELAAKAQTIRYQFEGDDYWNKKAIHDAETPASDDPERLALAKQATEFINGKGENPFKGMSRDKLALISYDDSGEFTINERRAASCAAYDQEIEWKTAICQKMMDENHSYGEVSAESYRQILNHYKSLPAIEEAQLQKGYDKQLQSMIDGSYYNESAENKNEFYSIIELAKIKIKK